MVKQLSFIGDGRMIMNAGKQDDIVFVCFYRSDEPHDLNKRAPQPFNSMEELLSSSEVILNFNNVKSIENLISTLEDAKAMFNDIEAFKRENHCDILDGDA